MIFSWSFISSASSDHVNNVLQLDARQESDSLPYWPVNMLPSWTVSLAGVWLTVLQNCTSRSIMHPEEREEFCPGIKDQRDVKSDLRSAGGPLVWRGFLTRFGVDFKKGSNKRAPLHTWCIFDSHWAPCQTMGVGFSISVFSCTELSKDSPLLNIVRTYMRMDACRAFGDVWL